MTKILILAALAFGIAVSTAVEVTAFQELVVADCSGENC